MPGILLVPFFTFVLVASSVRSRRAVSNLTALGLIVTLADVALVLAARARKFTDFAPVQPYPWINFQTSFVGAPQFTGFGIDISFRVDHLALVVVAAVLVLALASVAWHRVTGRQEPGGVRFHSLLLLGVLGANGFAVSGDLGASLTWWGLTGIVTYLLLTHRWGVEASTRPARLALGLPFLGDLALLAAVAILYSRFGTLLLDRLSPLSVLHGTYGAGLRTVTAACLLVGLAAMIRGGLFPFTAWLATPLESPPAALAWVRGTWPLLGFVLLYRTVPIFNAAGPEAYRVLAYAFAVAVVGGALLSMAGNDLRRGLAWAGAGAVALVYLGFGRVGTSPSGAAAMVALGLLLPALALGSTSVAAAMRSRVLEDMGEVRRRMPMTAVTLGGAAVAIPIVLVPRLASAASWHGWPFLGLGSLLVGFALVRLAAAPILAPLRRRRAFEPNRVRDLVAAAGWTGAALVGLGAAMGVLGYFDPYTRWLVGPGGRVPGGALVLQLLLAVVAIAAGVAAGALDAPRRSVLRVAARAGAGFAAAAATASALWERTAPGAGLELVGAVEERGLEGGEGSLGRGLSSLGARAAAGLAGAPVIATGALVLVVLVAAAVFSPGVYR